jgi:ferredoxin
LYEVPLLIDDTIIFSMDKYWTSLEEKKSGIKKVSHINRNKENGDSVHEILDDSTLNAPSSRRDFLKLFGFSIATATIVSACEQPIRKAIPYLIAPEEITPGKASYYASTFYDGQDYCSILVKVRDGRPIKIEGNDLSPVTKGGTSARIQASVLGIYDDARYMKPLINNKEVSWEAIDNEITGQLKSLVAKGKDIILITPTIISPSTKEVIKLFISKYPTVKHIQYDTVSTSGILEANKNCFGHEVIPSYRFDKAEVIVSFAADFLGTWLSPIEFAKQYSKSRSLTEGQKKISKHIQFEPGLSLTGSNADLRTLIKPSQEKTILVNLYNEIAKATGFEAVNSPESPVEISGIAKELVSAREKSLVISGSNDPEIQIIVNAINHALGNYGNTIDLENHMLHRLGKDIEMATFIEGLKTGKIGGAIFYDTNPLYDYPQSKEIKKYVEKLEMVVSLTSPFNETSVLAAYICPDHHYLESWNDAEIKPGIYSLTQPPISPLFNTRQAQDSLLKWAGNTSTYHDFIKEHWQKNQFRKSGQTDFFKFWNKCLESGVFEIAIKPTIKFKPYTPETLKAACREIENRPEGLEISIYEKIGPGSGKHANNPWLQEMPDPVTRATWDNYLCVSPKYAGEKGWVSGDLVTIDNVLEIPVLIQPGQAYGTASAAIGYGRKISGKVAQGVGVNVFPLTAFKNGNRSYHYTVSKIEKTGSGHKFALTQTHHSMEGRAIIREAHLDEYNKEHTAGNEMHTEYEEHNQSLYKNHNYPGHHWGMSIDLNKCIGCSACVVACSVENNVPVVENPKYCGPTKCTGSVLTGITKVRKKPPKRCGNP